MRYFLRKYKEKINQFKPIQLCFDNNEEYDYEQQCKSQQQQQSNQQCQKQLASIPEHNNETSFEMANEINYNNNNNIQSLFTSNCILTRSKLRQQQQQLQQQQQNGCVNKHSPIVTLTAMSKKLLTNSHNSPFNIQTKSRKTQNDYNEQQQQNDLIKLQQNLLSKFNDTESDDDDIFKTNKRSQQQQQQQQQLQTQQQLSRIKSKLPSSTSSSSSSRSIITPTTTSSCSSSSSASSSAASSSDSDNEENFNNKNKNVKQTGTTPPHKKFRKLRLFDTPQTPKTLIKKSSLKYADKSGKMFNKYMKEICDEEVTSIDKTSPIVRDEHRLSLRVRLFDHNGNTIENSETINDLNKTRSPTTYQLQANINPFTPNHSIENSIITATRQMTTNDSTISATTSSTTMFVDVNTTSNNFIMNSLSINSTSSTSSNQFGSIVNSNLSIKRNRNDLMRFNGDDGNNCGDNCGDEHGDDDSIPKNKRLALRQCLVSRYHEEFHEVCKLGAGEFGDVFKCINRLDGCTYAIKRSKKPIAGSALEISAWKEVCAHAVLVKHNHIVQYYSAWAEADRMLIQNEYCNGGSLAEYIETNRLNSHVMNEIDLKLLLLHTAKGLAYMHSLNLVHLDIKPGNIFICRNPRRPTSMIISEESGIESEIETEENLSETITYKIGDLGHVTSTLDARVEEGDCRYLPNEILQEQYDHLTKADIFALALTVYVCGSNEDLPKNGDEWHWIRQGNLKDMPQCSDRFKKLLIQMINEKPILRPSAITLIHHPCICPDASKNKAQLLKELNQEKFKNELLQRKVRQYEQQIKVASPVKKSTQNKFSRSLSCNLLT